MTSILASVANLEEARLMVAAGADFIDLKDPGAGALGALPAEAVAGIVSELGGVRPVSATVGDLPMDAGRILPEVEARIRTGVTYIKIGWFPGGDPAGVLAALRPLTQDGARLIGVLLADRSPNLSVISHLAAAGFAGVMLDTAGKAGGSLLGVSPPRFIADFVELARKEDLLCGLAGSLRSEDVPVLKELRPDFLGFRGALCGGDRTAGIDAVVARNLIAVVKDGGSNLSPQEFPCSTD